MSEQKLDPTVLAFKTFINNHPKLITEIRKNGRSWQEYYEKWLLLGEDDSFWDTYKESDVDSESKSESGGKKAELFSQIVKLTNQIDFDRVQNQVSQLNETLSTVQELINQYKKSKNPTPKERPNHLFHLFRD